MQFGQDTGQDGGMAKMLQEREEPERQKDELPDADTINASSRVCVWAMGGSGWFIGWPKAPSWPPTSP